MSPTTTEKRAGIMTPTSWKIASFLGKMGASSKTNRIPVGELQRGLHAEVGAYTGVIAFRLGLRRLLSASLITSAPSTYVEKGRTYETAGYYLTRKGKRWLEQAPRW